MSKIKILDHELANQIAAGEVIERPASVVKELVENSIDAGATVISVFITQAGRERIIVSDNGTGMDKEDLILAFSPHATSKISSTFDLFKIMTLGFRGEALPSIASVSKINIETAQEGGEGFGADFVSGEVKVYPAAVNKGTTVKVEELFYNTPVRLKFLKQDYTEEAVILDIVTKLALANDSISFNLYFDDKLRFKTTGRGDLKETILNIYGINYVRNLLPVSFKNNDFSLKGYLGNSTLVRSNKYGIITNLNGRNVYMPKINRAINEAYRGFIAPSRYPFVVLNFTIEPELVDVNVHPTKKEVRFSKEDDLIEALLEAIPKSLQNDNFIPYSIPIKKVEVEEKSEEEKEPSIQMFLPLSDHEPVEEEEALLEDDIFRFHKYNNEPEKEILVDDKFVEQKRFEPIGSIHQTYIICQTPDGGFWLIDQHAAHERINFEKFQKFLTNRLMSRPLLVPELVFLTPQELNNFTPEVLALLEKVGLEVEVFGSNILRITAVPHYSGEYKEKVYIQNIIDEVLAHKKVNEQALRSNAIATMACKASIKANHRLSIAEMDYLVTELLNCENPYSCPHGRPTIVKFNKYDIEKMFKRTGT